jgi:hypothetical protein
MNMRCLSAKMNEWVGLETTRREGVGDGERERENEE